MSLVSANKTETNTYALEVAIDAAAFAAAVQQVYLKQRKSIQLPGFRKGKAPRAMIEKLYGKEVFYEDAIEDLFPAAVSAAYDEAGITPVDQPKDVDFKTMTLEDGVVFTFNVTVKPEITIEGYKGIEAPRSEPTVTEAEVKEELDRMLERGARLVDVDDRPVQDGDITVIDFEGFVDGVPFEGGKAEKYSLTIGSGSFIPGFEEQIIGHSIGEDFDVNVTFPAEYAEELASKDAVFKIKLHEIKYKEMPELDDEFAKDMGDYETVDELKKGIEEDILKRKTDSAQRAFEDAVLQTLCGKVEGEIPDCMYDNKAKDNIDSFTQRVSQQGLDLDTYLMYMGMDKEIFEQQMRERAVNDVKLDLALEKIIEAEAIKPDDDAIAAEYQKMADMYQIELERVKALVSEASVADELARQDAIKLIVDSAVAVPAQDEADADAAAPAEDAE
ncbi:MAG: trigger factor [Clostridia bacterium]|nr:trigger factor [Clostridia bacterium]